MVTGEGGEGGGGGAGKGAWGGGGLEKEESPLEHVAQNEDAVLQDENLFSSQQEKVLQEENVFSS